MLPAFFDTCSQHPDATNGGFVLAEKMAPARRHVVRILKTAERLDAPVLSTTCLGLQRGNPSMCVRTACAAASTPDGGREQPAFVAMDATADDVTRALGHRRIMFERRSCKSPDDNVRLRTFDVFGVNRHAGEIVRRLGARHWYVFGAGFEHCLLAAVEGLRGLGVPVTVLEDGLIHGGRSVPASFLRSYQRILELGAGWDSFEATGLAIDAAA